MLLVVGANGFVGRNIVGYFRAHGRDVCTASHTAGCDVPIDLRSDRWALEGLGRFPIRAAIVCSGITDIDRCSAEPDLAWLFNVKRTIELITRLQDRGIGIILCSSDMVFAGERGEYRETDECAPTTTYGGHKRDVEAFLSARGIPHAVLRMSKLYSIDESSESMVHRTISTLRSASAARFATDQVIVPTCVDDIARTVAVILDRRLDGTFHVSPRGRFTRYELALELARRIGLPERVIGCSLDELSAREKRPKLLSLDGSRSAARTGVQPVEFHEAIDRISMGYSVRTAESVA